MAASDLITLAFISALRSYQQDHQQEPTYSLADWQELEAQHTKDLAEQQQQLQEVPEVGSTAGPGAEHQQDVCESLSQADTNEVGFQQTTEVPSSEQSDRHMPQMATTAQRAAEETQQGSGNHDRVRTQYTRKQMLQLQPQQQTAQHANRTAAPNNANNAAKRSATKPASTSIEQQSQQHYQQQQQQQQQWYSQCYWGGPYSYWDGTTWTTSAPPAAAAAAAAPGSWDWSSSEHQQHTDGAQQQQQQQPVSTPPAAPPLPPAYPHYCGTASDPPQVCTVCGKAINTFAAPVKTSVRDQETVKSALKSQIPQDIAAVPESLAAAEAAIVKTVALSQSAECRNSMPELMMAWFYAGYHAGKLSSGGPGCSSSSSRAARHEAVKSAGGD